MPDPKDTQSILDRLLRMPVVKEQLDAERNEQAESRAAVMRELAALEADWAKRGEPLGRRMRETAAESERAQQAATAALERAQQAQHAFYWHASEVDHKRRALLDRLAPLGQHAVLDARRACDWAIESARSLRAQATAEREYVHEDLLGRFFKTFKRDEAPHLTEFEAQAEAVRGRIDAIERQALSVEDLEAALRTATARLTPTALYEALFADRPDLRPSADQIEQERARIESEKARVRALDERQRIAWEARIEAGRLKAAKA